MSDFLLKQVIPRIGYGIMGGSFVICLVLTIIVMTSDHMIMYEGILLTKWFAASMIIGLTFSMSGLIHAREEIPLPIRISFQLTMGFSVFAYMSTRFHWIGENDLGIKLAVTIAAILTIGFYLFFYISCYYESIEINNKIRKYNENIEKNRRTGIKSE